MFGSIASKSSSYFGKSINRCLSQKSNKVLKPSLFHVPKRYISNEEVENGLKRHGLSWPGEVKPKANYLGVTRSEELMFLSGHLPYDPPHQNESSTLIKGKIGKDLSAEDGKKAAKYCAVALLGTLRANINNWEHVRKIVRITGYVNCVEGYEQLPDIIDGASNILVDVLGEQKGLHARSAIGVASLPYNAAVEIEMVVQLDDRFA